MSIAAVERDTGLSKDTLRVWERRYGFPVPLRDALGERSYPFDQVERLRTIKRLLDAGHRPGRVVSMSKDDLANLAAAVGAPGALRDASAASPPTDLMRLVALVKDNDVEGLRRALSRVLSRLGLGRFVLDVVAPLNVEVGEAWMQGQIEVFQEHLYTESVQVVLRNALSHLPPAGAGRPRVLLATVSGEPHGLGLLMAEAVLALEGCRCVSLGVQTPVWDIVRAADALDVQVVALSYTGCTNPNQVVDGLVELRSKLAPGVEVWAGGSAPVLQRRVIDGVLALPKLDRITDMLARWHAGHPSTY
ncbi:MAG: MerR family transcriptional regulator [Aquincola sp.]|nr:MerR family transcriptional regulator [Aquincola sp.]MDH4288636.1 MerR family transcriptional regulator [Aquincola sp.]